jgi:hypothetical protein
LVLAVAVTVLAAPLPSYVFLFHFELTQALMIFLFGVIEVKRPVRALFLLSQIV